jgi:hypothetical protein
VTDSRAHAVWALPLAPLFRDRRARSRRASSFDRTGANDDWVTIGPGETQVLLEHEGAGCVTHVYCAMILPDLREYRNAILRCYWDGSSAPSVEVPLGDFFGLAHGRVREFSSHLLAVNGGAGGSSHGLNAYFPMPYSSSALITLENRGPVPLGGPFDALWYHIDYETYDDPLPDDVQRFHASYRQERPTIAVGEPQNVTLHSAINDTGTENYVVVDTEGSGRMVGLVLEIENIQDERWYGEGDDMVFLDGEDWPPSIHGTGSEEIFGGGACPGTEYASAYSGFHLVESPRYDGLIAMYRWFLHDPLHFARSLRWTVEHGHANNFANNYASVGYWYQSPQAVLPALPSAETMLPPLREPYEEARERLFGLALRYMGHRSDPELAAASFRAACDAGANLYRGDFQGALEAVEQYEAGT